MSLMITLLKKCVLIILHVLLFILLNLILYITLFIDDET